MELLIPTAIFPEETETVMWMMCSGSIVNNTENYNGLLASFTRYVDTVLEFSLLI
jgi:hypothetical protein